MKKLAVFTHKLFYDTPRGPETTGAFTIQLDALASYFSTVTVCVPVASDPTFSGVGFTSPNIRVHALPAFKDRLGFIRFAPSIRSHIHSALGEADLALVYLPSYVGILASLICQRRHFPLFHWIVGDWGKNVSLRRDSRGPQGWLADHVIQPGIDQLIKRLTRDALTFYNGQILFDQGKPYHYTRTSSSIQAKSFFHRSSNPGQPLKILFVGRLSPEKGVSYLIQAAAQLLAKGVELELHIVGTGELEMSLRQQANLLELGERVHFHGFIPQGEKLQSIYRGCDVLVVPSLQDQQPKVLLEAMSQSLPVVAARVGGIPSIVKDGVNGLLVKPGDSRVIAAAVQRAADPALRERLMKAGLETASEHTIEKETERTMHLVAEYFHWKDLFE